MKKLMMFAAAMTIVSGAYAQCSDPDIDPTFLSCITTYNVKMNLRTVSGKAFKSDTIVDTGLCSDDLSVSVSGCIRVPKVPLVLDGYLIVCGCDCDALRQADTCWLFLGSKKLQSVLVTTEDSDASFAFDWIHQIGANGKSAETSWSLLTGVAEEDGEIYDGDYRSLIGRLSLVGTGFGTYNMKHDLFTSFSGGTVGWLFEPRCLLKKDCVPAGYFDCFEYFSGLTEDGDWIGPDEELFQPGAIYGTWAMKLNTKLSGRYDDEKFGVSTLLRKMFPAWAYSQYLQLNAFECLFDTSIDTGNY